MACRKVSYASALKNSERNNGYKRQLHQQPRNFDTVLNFYNNKEILRKLYKRQAQKGDLT
jgi:hypothetical protein